MAMVSASELASTLGVSAGRVSQYVSGGKLDGCFTGEGRARRFDTAKVASALGKNLHPGQMLGNGASTKRAVASLDSDAQPRELPLSDAAPVAPRRSDTELTKSDPDRYELARIISAEERARRERRDNLLAEGHYVLASEVERQVAQTIGQEVREFETVMRDGARKIADELGVDFLVARKLLTDTWRAHRANRTKVLEGAARDASMSDAEREGDV